MKKLIPALCLLLISAMLMGTSTYAWFSMNSTVSATNMQVKAVTDGSLYISNADQKPNYKDIVLDTVAFSDANPAELKPTSTINLTQWYAVSAQTADAYAKSSSADFSLIDSADYNGYFLKKTVYIRSEKDINKLQVSNVTINPTRGQNDEVLEKSLTVAVKVTALTDISNNVSTPSTAPAFVANEETTVRHGAVRAATGTETAPQVDTTSITFTQIGNPVVIWDDTSANAVADASNYVFTVEIYIYFDGQSGSCYSNALLNVATLSAIVNVSFTSAD